MILEKDQGYPGRKVASKNSSAGGKARDCLHVFHGNKMEHKVWP